MHGWRPTPSLVASPHRASYVSVLEGQAPCEPLPPASHAPSRRPSAAHASRASRPPPPQSRTPPASPGTARNGGAAAGLLPPVPAPRAVLGDIQNVAALWPVGFRAEQGATKIFSSAASVPPPPPPSSQRGGKRLKEDGIALQAQPAAPPPEQTRRRRARRYAATTVASRRAALDRRELSCAAVACSRVAAYAAL